MDIFTFLFKGHVFFGKGQRIQLNRLIKEKNYKSVCIVIDHALTSLSIFKDLIDSLNCDKIIIDCDISEPTYDKLEEKRLQTKNKKIDAFVGIGGGSALDMAKGLSVLFTNSQPAIFYRGFEKFDVPIKPIIAIPTTAGTGSEITPNASFIDTKEKKKMGINGEGIRPSFSILDPELTLSCPKFPSLSAGVDSLVHASEAFVAKKSNPMAKLFAKKGFNIVINNIPKLLNDKLEDIRIRESLMYGAFLSAIALMNSGTGPAAAMSYPLGVHFKVPHGIGGGIFLPHVIEHNIKNGFYEYSELTEKSDMNLSMKENSNNFIKNLWTMWEELKVPQNLNSFGMEKTDIEMFVNDTMALKLALEENPTSFGENEIKEVLNKLLI